jgi:hypothetical protein
VQVADGVVDDAIKEAIEPTPGEPGPLEPTPPEKKETAMLETIATLLGWMGEMIVLFIDQIPA